MAYAASDSVEWSALAAMESEFPNHLRSQAFEVLSSNDVKPMESLFLYYFSPQQTYLRSQAHAFISCCKKHFPDLLFIKLFFLIRCGSVPDARANAIRVLLLVSIRDLWPTLSEDAKLSLKKHYIALLKEETSLPVLRMFSRVVAETLSAIYVGWQQWREIVEFLVKSIGLEDNVRLQEVAILVFAYLSEHSQRFVFVILNDKAIHNSFSLSLLKGLASKNFDILSAAIQLAVSFTCLLSDSLEGRWFHEALRAMMVGVFHFLNSSQDGYALRALQEFMRLLVRKPEILKPYVNDMIIDMIQIADSSTVSEEIRSFATGVVIRMTEIKDLVPIIIQLSHEVMVSLVGVFVKMMLSVEDTAWNGIESVELGVEGENADKFTLHNFGIECLTRLSIALSGRNIVPGAFELVSSYSCAPEWQKRLAAITLLTILSRECSDEMILTGNYLGEAVTKLMNFLQDTHVRVRLAAFSFMQMPGNLVQVMQILYHRRILQAFITALDKENHDKVKEQAVSALLVFLKNTLPESFTIYVDVGPVMSKLLALLKATENAKQRSMILNIFNLVALKCRQIATRYHVNYLPTLLDLCNDKDFEVKEEATRGIRIIAELGTPEFKPFIKRVISVLSLVIRYPNRSYSEDVKAKAYDIAVSALGRICEFHRDCIDASKLIPAWLNLLPLKNDIIEAKLMHEQLCAMVARLDKDLLSCDEQNLGKTVSVFVEVISKGDNLATVPTVLWMRDLVKQIWQKTSPSTLDAILFSLNPQQRELLMSIIYN